MKKGFLFSFVVILLVTFLVLMTSYLLVRIPSEDISVDLEKSRFNVVKLFAEEVTEFIEITKTTGGVTLNEKFYPLRISILKSNLENIKPFIDNYRNSSTHNMYFDDFNMSTYLGNDELLLIGSDFNYSWDGDQFLLEQRSPKFFLNVSVPNLKAVNASWTPSLSATGDVELRIRVNEFDHEDGVFTSFGEEHTFTVLLFNETTNTTEGTVDLFINTDGNLLADYSNIPGNFSHQVTIETSHDGVYMAFGNMPVNTTSTVNPGFDEPNYTAETAAIKHYGNGSYDGAFYNFILVDSDSDTEYDSFFIDVNGDGNFTESVDKSNLSSETVFLLGGKAFYATFTINGNRMIFWKVLAVFAEEETGTSISAVKL